MKQRCAERGIPLSELDLLSIGTGNDMHYEKNSNDYDYPAVTSQEDMNRFQTKKKGEMIYPIRLVECNLYGKCGRN